MPKRVTLGSCGNSLMKIGGFGLLIAAVVCSPAHAAGAAPSTLVVLPIKLLDTSNEPTDQASQHAKRLVDFADHLAGDLTRSGLYRASVITPDRLRQDCRSEEAACLLKVAQAHGAETIFIGVVHKSSTLIMQLWVRIVDARTGRDIYSRDLNFRGDTDEAWRRAETFLMSQIRDMPAEAR